MTHEELLKVIFQIIDCGDAGRQECLEMAERDNDIGIDCEGCIRNTIENPAFKWTTTDPKGRPRCFDSEGNALKVADIERIYGSQVAACFED